MSELLSSYNPSSGICEQLCKVMTQDGREVYLHGNVQLLTDESGNVAGAVGTFMDITSLVQADEKIALLEEQARSRDRFEQLIGASPAMQEVFRRLKLAADSDVTVLITGESGTGTGKELAAKAIHAQSARSERPFVAVNCSALPDAILESELFAT